MEIFPEDENGDVLNRMRDGGDNMEIPRVINFSVVFDSELGASKFLANVSNISGLSARVSPHPEEDPPIWDVTVDKFMLPTHAGITGFEKEIESMAAPYGGYNDGWGCFRQ